MGGWIDCLGMQAGKVVSSRDIRLHQPLERWLNKKANFGGSGDKNCGKTATAMSIVLELLDPLTN